MKIAKVGFNGNIFLAPMANVTNLAFRMMCREYGASGTCSEMISSDAIVYDCTKAFGRGSSCDDERPFVIQIFGNSSNVISKAALKIEERYRPDIIDINFGCPAHLLTKDGSGSALLDAPDTMYQIIRELTETISTPVTAKIRVLKDMEKTVHIGRIVEKAGASAITVHGRTQEQQYAGKADHEYAKRIKSEVSIPVIVNGDIKDEISALNTLEYTGCDGIMIGRAAMGNPFLFRRIDHFLKTGEMLQYDERQQRSEDFGKYMELLEMYGLTDMVDLRVHAQWFTKGIPGGKHIRTKLATLRSIEEIQACMKGMDLNPR